MAIPFLRLSGQHGWRNRQLGYRGACLALTAVLLMLIWVPLDGDGFRARLEGMVYDAMLPYAAPLTDFRVVLVDIDEMSLAKVGRWPWPRERTAELLAQVRQAGAAAVGVDVLFPEPETVAGDAALGAELSRDGVVAAVAFGWEAGQLPASLSRPQPVSSGSGANSLPWLSASREVGLAPSLTPFLDSAVVGHITPVHDPDHVIRRVQPVLCGKQRCYATLALAMLESWSGVPVRLEPSRWGPDRVCVASFCLSLNADHSVSVPYHQASRFVRLPAWELLEGDVAGSAGPLLEGAMVLIGTSAVGLGDVVATPVSATTPGVDIHALLLAAALDGVAWSTLPGARGWLSVAVLSVMGLVFAVPVRERGWRVTALGWASLLLVLTFVLPRFGYWLPPLPVWSAWAGALLLVGLWLSREQWRQRRQLYRAFSAYVPREVIKTLVRHNLRPEQLDAQRVEATVMFADIRGFTALSERLEPEELVDLTNQLFTAITEEIHRQRGTLDKYMGDAVMAFWGAPLPQADHALQALRCAQAIQQRLRGMVGWLEDKGYPGITMTIGLESGPVAVGNFGSRQRRAYTVMGKTVNLAAHLQPLCSAYDAEILCGPGLCAQLPEEVRPLGSVVIRGIDGKQVIGTPA